jgi:hypothetical protein
MLLSSQQEHNNHDPTEDSHTNIAGELLLPTLDCELKGERRAKVNVVHQFLLDDDKSH